MLTYCTGINKFGVIEHVRGESLLLSVYRNNLHVVEELKDEVIAVVENISEEILVGVMKNLI